MHVPGIILLLGNIKKNKEYPSQTQQSLVLQKLVNERTKYDKEQRSI
jgi:hypothetical protein